MPERRVAVIVSSGDGVEARGAGVVSEIAPTSRMLRAAGYLLGAMLLAASLIPIPIIHFIGPPTLLLVGMVTAVRQLCVTVRLAPLRIACPKCGGVNRIGGGLGLRDPDRPLEIRCESCRRGLTVRLEGVAG